MTSSLIAKGHNEYTAREKLDALRATAYHLGFSCGPVIVEQVNGWWYARCVYTPGKDE